MTKSRSAFATGRISLRSAFQSEIETNVEFGEAVLTMLKRKAECQLEIIAPAYGEHLVEFWRALLDMQTVQAKLESRAPSAVGAPGLTVRSAAALLHSGAVFAGAVIVLRYCWRMPPITIKTSQNSATAAIAQRNECPIAFRSVSPVPARFQAHPTLTSNPTLKSIDPKPYTIR